MSVTTQKHPELVTSAPDDNRLATLATEIQEAEGRFRRSAQEAAAAMIEAGHKLLEAKALIAHGNWLPWLTEHAKLSQRTAQRYMRFAKLGGEIRQLADLPTLSPTDQKMYDECCAALVDYAGSDGFDRVVNKIADPDDAVRFLCAASSCSSPIMLALLFVAQEMTNHGLIPNNPVLRDVSPIP
jgi:hypothetical protein